MRNNDSLKPTRRFDRYKLGFPEPAVPSRCLTPPTPAAGDLTTNLPPTTLTEFVGGSCRGEVIPSGAELLTMHARCASPC
jgi:hypothetical protein